MVNIFIHYNKLDNGYYEKHEEMPTEVNHENDNILPEL